MAIASRISGVLLGASLGLAVIIGIPAPAQAAAQTLTLTSCYSDVAGQTFEVAQGDTLQITFTDPCTWAYDATFVGFSRESPGTGENEVAVYDAWNAKVADVTRPGSPGGQATILITPNPAVKTTLTSTSGSYFRTVSDNGYQRFFVKVTATPDTPANPDWEPLGEGTNNTVLALAAGPGDTVYAGGYFSIAGSTSANRIAAWDGAQWHALGTGISGTVNALAVDGTGVLYAGGQFSSAGGGSAQNIAKWNGTSWSALGSGSTDEVTALAVDDSGRVYAGSRGFFSSPSGVSVWNGSTWSSLGSSFNQGPLALVAANGRVYAGGSFTLAGGVSASRIAQWDGSAWSSLGGGLGNTVRALLADSSGAIYAGGDFTTAGGQPANRIAKWDGTAWSALGSGLDNSVYALQNDADGNIYAAGAFTNAGGQPANRVAKWDGTAWSAVGTGMTSAVTELAMTMTGDLYAGGSFISAGGDMAYRVAMYPGADPAPTTASEPAPSMPVAAPQAFAVPEGTDAASCGVLAPQSVDWPGIAHLRDAGWTVAYAEWPNDHTGGWVCQRQPLWVDGAWAFQ